MMKKSQQSGGSRHLTGRHKACPYDLNLQISGVGAALVAARQSQKGFTLVEVLVALSIFAIGAVSVFVVFPASSMALRQAKEYTEVGLVLDSQLAAVSATPFDELADRTVTTHLPSFVERVDVVVTPDPDFGDVKRVTVTAAYTSKGRARSESMVTHVVQK